MIFLDDVFLLLDVNFFLIYSQNIYMQELNQLFGSNIHTYISYVTYMFVPLYLSPKTRILIFKVASNASGALP